MEFILNTFTNITDLPLIEYVAGAFVFVFVFFLLYRLVGVK